MGISQCNIICRRDNITHSFVQSQSFPTISTWYARENSMYFTHLQKGEDTHKTFFEAYIFILFNRVFQMIRLSSSSSRNTNISVISLLSIDVARFEILFAFTPYIATVPVQLLIVTYLIWRYVGLNATLVGITLMIFLSLPVQGLLFQRKNDGKIITDEN